jgi:hypothetical protein
MYACFLCKRLLFLHFPDISCAICFEIDYIQTINRVLPRTESLKGETMHTDHHRKSATIYMFPLSPRLAQRGGVGSQDMERIKNYVDCSSSYHQDAINEELEHHTISGKPHS